MNDARQIMIRNEIINVMAKCSCGTRIAWTRSNDTVEHRGVVDEFYPENGVEDAYLSVIEPHHFTPVLGASEIETIRILEDKHHEC
jgi:hypothetical protein